MAKGLPTDTVNSGYSAEISSASTIELTAPESATIGGETAHFARWNRNGHYLSRDLSISFSINSPAVLEAVYVQSKTLTLSSNQDSVTLMVNPADVAGVSRVELGTSPDAKALKFPAGASISVGLAPGEKVKGTKVFSHWVVDSVAKLYGLNALHLDMDADHELEAVYADAVTVQIFNSVDLTEVATAVNAAGETMPNPTPIPYFRVAVSPPDVIGKSFIQAGDTLTYPAGTVLHLTAQAEVVDTLLACKVVNSQQVCQRWLFDAEFEEWEATDFQAAGTNPESTTDAIATDHVVLRMNYHARNPRDLVPVKIESRRREATSDGIPRTPTPASTATATPTPTPILGAMVIVSRIENVDGQSLEAVSLAPIGDGTPTPEPTERATNFTQEARLEGFISVHAAPTVMDGTEELHFVGWATGFTPPDVALGGGTPADLTFTVDSAELTLIAEYDSIPPPIYSLILDSYPYRHEGIKVTWAGGGTAIDPLPFSDTACEDCYPIWIATVGGLQFDGTAPGGYMLNVEAPETPDADPVSEFLYWRIEINGVGQQTTDNPATIALDDTASNVTAVAYYRQNFSPTPTPSPSPTSVEFNFSAAVSGTPLADIPVNYNSPAVSGTDKTAFPKEFFPGEILQLQVDGVAPFSGNSLLQGWEINPTPTILEPFSANSGSLFMRVDQPSHLIAQYVPANASPHELTIKVQIPRDATVIPAPDPPYPDIPEATILVDSLLVGNRLIPQPITPAKTPTSGDFYKYETVHVWTDREIILTAVEPAGFMFGGWAIESGDGITELTKEKRCIVNVSSNVGVIAYFRPVGPPNFCRDARPLETPGPNVPPVIKFLNTNGDLDCGDDRDVAIAADGDGLWVAAWISYNHYDDGNFTPLHSSDPTAEINYATSTDVGQTWSDPIRIPLPTTGPTIGFVLNKPSIAVNSVGEWMVGWWAFRGDTNSEDEINDGVNQLIAAKTRNPLNPGGWTSKLVYQDNVYNVALDLHMGRGQIADDRFDTCVYHDELNIKPGKVSDLEHPWVFAWASNMPSINTTPEPNNLGYDFDIIYTRINATNEYFASESIITNTSDDIHFLNNYATEDNDCSYGGTPYNDGLLAQFNGGLGGPVSPINRATSRLSVDTDGEGHWVAVWVSSFPLEPKGVDVELVYSISDDDGAHWSPSHFVESDVANESMVVDPIYGYTYGPGRETNPTVRSDGSDGWLLSWGETASIIAVAKTNWDMLTKATQPGQTPWGTPKRVFDYAPSGPLLYTAPFSERLVNGMSMESDHHGNWTIMYMLYHGIGLMERYITSHDDGETWSSVQTAVCRYVAELELEMGSPTLASDKRGGWVAAWNTYAALYDSSSTRIQPTGGLCGGFVDMDLRTVRSISAPLPTPSPSPVPAPLIGHDSLEVEPTLAADAYVSHAALTTPHGGDVLIILDAATPEATPTPTVSPSPSTSPTGGSSPTPTPTAFATPEPKAQMGYVRFADVRQAFQDGADPAHYIRALRSARLEMTLAEAPENLTTSAQLALYAVIDPMPSSPWGEMTIDWGNQPGSGIHAAAAALHPGATQGTIVAWDVTDDIARFLGSELEDHPGWSVRISNGPPDLVVKFASREHSTVNPPRLILSFFSEAGLVDDLTVATPFDRSTAIPPFTPEPTGTPLPADVRWIGYPAVEAGLALGLSSGSTGLCMEAVKAERRDLVWSMLAIPSSRAADLVDNAVYRARVAVTYSTEEAAPNPAEIPPIAIEYGNFFWGYVYNTGTDHFRVNRDDNPEFRGFTYNGAMQLVPASGVGDNAPGLPQGRAFYDFWLAPNAVQTKQWRGLVDPDSSAFSAYADGYNDFILSIRMNDVQFGTPPEPTRTLCLTRLSIHRFDINTLPVLDTVWNPPLTTAYFSPQDKEQAHEGGEAFIANEDRTAHYALAPRYPGSRKTLVPVDASLVEEHRNQALYPLLWESDVLYKATALIRSDVNGGTGTTEGMDPVDSISLNMSVPTNEILQIHNTFRGEIVDPAFDNDKNMLFAASPRLPATVGGEAQPYLGFFFTHNRTLSTAVDAARARVMVDFMNLDSVGNGAGLDGRVTGRDPFAVTGFKVEKILIPETLEGVQTPRPTPTATPGPIITASSHQINFVAKLESSQLVASPHPNIVVDGRAQIQLDTTAHTITINLALSGIDTAVYFVRLRGNGARGNPAGPVLKATLTVNAPDPTSYGLEADTTPYTIEFVSLASLMSFEQQILADGLSLELYRVIGSTTVAYARGQIEVDYDDDGLSGWVELNELQPHTNPLDRDSDDDGLADGEEAMAMGPLYRTIRPTNPALADTDRDGIADGLEMGLGADQFAGATLRVTPVQKETFILTPDGDTIRYWDPQWGVGEDGVLPAPIGIGGTAGMLPTAWPAGLQRFDSDLSTKTDPSRPDSDGDGFWDGPDLWIENGDAGRILHVGEDKDGDGRLEVNGNDNLPTTFDDEFDPRSSASKPPGVFMALDENSNWLPDEFEAQAERLDQIGRYWFGNGVPESAQTIIDDVKLEYGDPAVSFTAARKMANSSGQGPTDPAGDVPVLIGEVIHYFDPLEAAEIIHAQIKAQQAIVANFFNIVGFFGRPFTKWVIEPALSLFPETGGGEVCHAIDESHQSMLPCITASPYLLDPGKTYYKGTFINGMNNTQEAAWEIADNLERVPKPS